MMGDRIVPAGRRTLYDSYRRCSCGHIAAHHHADDISACRLCEACQGFRPRPRCRSCGR